MPKKPPTLLYVVYWKDEAILKVGRANHMGRVRKHMSTGAKVIVLIRNRTINDERLALQVVDQCFARAFDRWQDATALLGPNGSGYSECYRVAENSVMVAVNAILRAVGRG